MRYREDKLNQYLVLGTLVALILLAPVHVRSQQNERLFPVSKDGQWGFIDRSGKVVIPPQFDDAREFHEGLALVTAGKKKQFIDTSGRVVIDATKYDVVNDFSEGVAAVNIGQTRIANIGLIGQPGKWGYMDKTGKLVIPMEFTHAEDFSEGLAAAGSGDHLGFIDHTGKLIFEVPLDVTLGFHDGIVGVLYRGSVSYFDRAGKKIPVATEYGPKSHSFSEGLVPMQTKGKWGFMNPAGQLVIPATFEDAKDFREGLAPVKVKGELVWCPAGAEGNRSGSTMRWGYVDKTGKIVITPSFESAEPFSEGLAEVHNCNESFFIDRTGKAVISGFTYASSFSGGLARFELLKESQLLSGYVDKAGKIVWGPAK